MTQLQRDEDLYRGAHISYHPIGPNQGLLHILETGQIMELDAAIVRVLGMCQGGRTLEHHATVIADAGVLADRGAIRPALQALVDVGLLCPIHREAHESERTPRRRRDITSIGIVTADRPRMLHRCLQSLVDHCDHFGLRPSIVIVDGSKAMESQTADREAIDNVRKRGYTVRHLKPATDSSSHQRLRPLGLEPTTIDLAIGSGDIGANRNALLLDTVGEAIVMIDDDILCDTWDLPERHDTPALVGHRDERHVSFHRSRADVFANVRWTRESIIHAHQRLLGATIQEVMAGTIGVDLSHACPHVLSGLGDQATNSSVRVTMAGIAGDSGVYCPYGVLFSSGWMRERLRASPEMLAVALESREVARVAAQPLITHDPACMAYCLGYLNTEPAMPFMPLGRNEDGIFGAMLSFLNPGTYFGHLPCGVVHDSGRPSGYEAGVIASASAVRLCDVVAAVVRVAASSSTWSGEPERTRALSSVLDELVRLPIAEFEQVLKRLLLDTCCQRLARLEAAVQAGGADGTRRSGERPPGWTAGCFCSTLPIPAFSCRSNFIALRRFKKAVSCFGPFSAAIGKSCWLGQRYGRCRRGRDVSLYNCRRELFAEGDSSREDGASASSRRTGDPVSGRATTAQRLRS